MLLASGVLVGSIVATPTPLLPLATLVLASILRRREVLSVLLVGVTLGGVAGLVDGRRTPDAALPVEGRAVITGVAVGDTHGVDGDRRLVVRISSLTRGGPVAAAGSRVLVRGLLDDLATGEPVLVQGRLRPALFRTREGVIRGVVEDASVVRLGEASNPLLRFGNRIRSRILGGLRSVDHRPEGALLAGFLIGDVDGLPGSDAEALRVAGLSHFVAVSGSNVALFLVAWWLVMGPLGWSPRRRALLGLVGVALFVVVTRWEPSVLRAAVMASVVLGGRLAGRAVSPWSALGWAVAVLVVVDAALAGQAGFQLSVAATAGILLGIPLWRGRRPTWLWTTLGATVSAQAAVAPLLLVHFGSVPLLAPLTNLVAAPLVAIATSLGGVGTVLGIDAIVRVATVPAGLVLAVARSAVDLPQLGVGGVGVLAGAGVLGWVLRSLRPALALVAVIVVGSSLVPVGPPGGPTVSFLDVGQGDSILFRGPAGEVVLVDGGPDPALLRRHLRELGVSHIDLLVISHRHADHTAGLVGLGVPVRALWHPPQLGEDGPFDRVVAEQSAAGAMVSAPAPGDVGVVGSFRLEVLGPLRRYASPNDGSIVLCVSAAGVSVLMTGDIEVHAQGDLGPVTSDILKVPHQGGATSDLDWLRASAAPLAVISVGPNSFGHPSEEVVAVLEAAGSTVLRTDRDGTITIRLDRIAAERPALPSRP